MLFFFWCKEEIFIESVHHKHKHVLCNKHTHTQWKKTSAAILRFKWDIKKMKKNDDKDDERKL